MIDSIVSGTANLIGTALTNKANREEAKKQRDFNVEMWNKQNQYNSPQAQKERLEQAGLNTNLMYGSGGVSNTANQIQSYQKPNIDWRVQMPMLLDSMMKLEDLKGKKIGNQNLAIKNQLDKQVLANYTPYMSKKLEALGQQIASGKATQGLNEFQLGRMKKGFIQGAPFLYNAFVTGQDENAIKALDEMTKRTIAPIGKAIGNLFKDFKLSITNSLGQLNPWKD